MIHTHGFIGRRGKEGEVGDSEGGICPFSLEKITKSMVHKQKIKQ